MLRFNYRWWKSVVIAWLLVPVTAQADRSSPNPSSSRSASSHRTYPRGQTGFSPIRFLTLALEKSDIVDKPLKQISFPKGAIVAGIIRKDDIIIPTGDSVIRPQDRVIIFARRPAIPKVEKILSVKLGYF